MIFCFTNYAYNDKFRFKTRGQKFPDRLHSPIELDQLFFNILKVIPLVKYFLYKYNPHEA